MITPSKEQSKRSAAHIFAAFQYQWDYFVLQLLATNDDTITVSFELLDDVDKQTGECITLYQIKHSYKPQNKMFHFCKTFCSKITLVNTIQNVILNPI